jgi:hypothetical protein
MIAREVEYECRICIAVIVTECDVVYLKSAPVDPCHDFVGRIGVLVDAVVVVSVDSDVSRVKG